MQDDIILEKLKFEIEPLLVDSKLTGGTGLLNPSLFFSNGKLMVNVRHVNYNLYHSENEKVSLFYGPLNYLHPEDDITLTTKNFLLELDENYKTVSCKYVETSKLDVRPLWEFIGLEDCRLFNWDDKMYLCGVRRDTTPNGQGRMELSEITISGDKAEEISRFRIPAPLKDDSYCEKNWMPILDLPYHFVKWCNPIEVVKVDPITKTCEQIHHGEFTLGFKDWRGGSQVFTWKDNYCAVVHEVDLLKTEIGNKDAIYRHRIIVWDKDWNRIKTSKPFSFMGGKIEFCCGGAVHNGKFILTFGFQDNASYIVAFDENDMEDYING
jgi:hypothetical protein